MDYIKYDEGSGLSLGALVTIRAVETSAIIREKFNILFQAAESMASPQVRNRGTIAGNICSAVPSADMAPALLTLEVRLKLISQRGERIVSIEGFFTGPSETVIGDDEMLQEFQVPGLPPQSKGIYFKLSPRRSMDLAMVGVALVAVPEDGILKDIRLALGAVSPTPVRVKEAEAIVRGQRLTVDLIEKAADIAAQGCCPISDHRASAEYRTDMVKVLTKRALNQVVSG